MNNQGSPLHSRPTPVSTAEFDRKVEAGEDIDLHLDWDHAISLEPGEPSSEQAAAMMGEKEAREPDSCNEASGSLHTLNISLPPWAFEQLQSDADRQDIRREELARLLILQRLDKQRAVA